MPQGCENKCPCKKVKLEKKKCCKLRKLNWNQLSGLQLALEKREKFKKSQSKV